MSAITGGLIAGGFAIWAGILAGNQAHRNNLKLDEFQKRKKIDGFLLAIRYELEIQEQIYKQGTGDRLENLKPGQPYDVYFSLKQQYFIVYPNNTDLVGQIDDSNLVEAIVVTYNTANNLIENYLINNWYLDRQRELQGLTTQLLTENRVKQAAILKAVHADLIHKKSDLLAKIDDYRIRHPIKPD